MTPDELEDHLLDVHGFRTRAVDELTEVAMVLAHDLQHAEFKELNGHWHPVVVKALNPWEYYVIFVGYLVLGGLTAAAGARVFPGAYARGWNGPMLGLTFVGWWVAWGCWLVLGSGALLSLLVRRGPRPDPYLSIEANQ